MQNLQLTFDWHYLGQKEGEDFVAFSEYMNFKTEKVQPTFVGIQVEQERQNLDHPQVAVDAATLSVNQAKVGN